MNRQVATNVYKAQVASDYAKRIYEIHYDEKIDATYHGKDVYIIRAIETIIHKKNTGFSFYVTIDDVMSADRGCIHYIVYFNFSIGGEKYQVSFHSLNAELGKYLKKDGTIHAVAWDEESSRDTCVLLKYYMDHVCGKEDTTM